MNVTDKWMVEQMQQMAAATAVTMPQTGGNEPARTEGGDSFKDLMDKAMDQRTDAAKNAETVDGKEPVQRAEQPRQVTVTKNEDGTETKSVELAAQEAAALAAGYIQLTPPTPDGTAWLEVPVGESAAQNNPIVEQIILGNETADAVLDQTAVFVNDEWVVQPTEEVAVALEQMLQETGDSRFAEDILGTLEQKLQNAMVKPEAQAAPSAGLAMSNTPVVIQSRGGKTSGGGVSQSSESEAAQPYLFKGVEGDPVKVAENFELEVEGPDMEEDLAEVIRFAGYQGLDKIEIKLSPANLGTLVIGLTHTRDGALQVNLYTTSAKVALLLSEHLDSLTQALKDYGQEIRIAVDYVDEKQQQQQFQQADPDGRNGQNQQQEQQREQQEHSEDFAQRMRLGLVEREEDV